MYSEDKLSQKLIEINNMKMKYIGVILENYYGSTNLSMVMFQYNDNVLKALKDFYIDHKDQICEIFMERTIHHLGLDFNNYREFVYKR